VFIRCSAPRVHCHLLHRINKLAIKVTAKLSWAKIQTVVTFYHTNVPDYITKCSVPVIIDTFNKNTRTSFSSMLMLVPLPREHSDITSCLWFQHSHPSQVDSPDLFLLRFYERKSFPVLVTSGKMRICTPDTNLNSSSRVFLCV
jgi:hypothetical protein